MAKRTHNDLQNTTQKTKYRATRTPLKTGYQTELTNVKKKQSKKQKQIHRRCANEHRPCVTSVMLHKNHPMVV